MAEKEREEGEREDSRREKKRAEGKKMICHVAVSSRERKKKGREKVKERGKKKQKNDKVDGDLDMCQHVIGPIQI